MSRADLIVLFDGDCAFCHRWVRFVARHDRHRRFRFAAARSPVGKRLLGARGLDPDHLESVVVLQGDRVFSRSAAVLAIVRHLGGPWPLLSLLAIVPPPLRDGLYRLVARNRDRLAGRHPGCMLPTAELQDRLLTDPPSEPADLHRIHDHVPDRERPVS